MREIFVSGDVSKDFTRLGINANLTFEGKDILEIKIFEVSDNDFDTLCNEPDIEGTWNNCGWRYFDGSNMDAPKNELLVNNKSLKCWYEEDEDPLAYDNLLEYLCWHLGASTFKNIGALATDLAKYNEIKLSTLFNEYQGDKQ